MRRLLEHLGNCTTQNVVTSIDAVTRETVVSPGFSPLSPVTPLIISKILIRAYRVLDFRFVTGDVVTTGDSIARGWFRSQPRPTGHRRVGKKKQKCRLMSWQRLSAIATRWGGGFRLNLRRYPHRRPPCICSEDEI